MTAKNIKPIWILSLFIKNQSKLPHNICFQALLCVAILEYLEFDLRLALWQFT